MNCGRYLNPNVILIKISPRIRVIEWHECSFYNKQCCIYDEDGPLGSGYRCRSETNAKLLWCRDRVTSVSEEGIVRGTREVLRRQAKANRPMRWQKDYMLSESGTSSFPSSGSKGYPSDNHPNPSLGVHNRFKEGELTDIFRFSLLPQMMLDTKLMVR